MKKNIILSLSVVCLTVFSAIGQSKYFTRNGKVVFDATTSTSPEKISGKNEKATSVLDASNGQMEFAILMKAFMFEKALMEEHFNENYVESDKFPKASFKGSIKNMSEINLSKDGSYAAKVSGKLTVHGVTKDVETNGSIVVKGGVVNAKSEFKILLSAYNVEIPSLVADKVAKEATITVDVNFEPLK
ncbi:MAG: YceI family protein [Bacteroidetes bacterium]|nr:YceI family protein [Bacteroidota bacterium]